MSLILGCETINRMLKKLQHKLLELQTSDFRLCVIKLNIAIQTLCHTIAGGLVQWLKLRAWKVGDRGFRPLI